MFNIFKKLLIPAIFILSITTSALAYEISTYHEASNFYDQYWAYEHYDIVVNSKNLMWNINYDDHSYTDMYIDSVYIGTVHEDDKEGTLRLLSKHLDFAMLVSSSLGGTGGGDEGSAYLSAAGKTSRLVFQQLVTPSVKTRSEKEKDTARADLGLSRSIGSALRFERAAFDDGDDGTLYGANIGMAWDQDNITYGFMLPYDYLDFDSFDANRLGLIGFGQYHMPLSDTLEASFTGHLNYTYSNINFDDIDNEIVNMFGGGLSTSLTYDLDMVEISTGVSYLYNKDDTNMNEDEQHLLKFGVNTGIRFGNESVLNLFGVWNADITNYDNDPQDDNYFELGAEGCYAFSDAWNLTLGAKKVVSLQDFDSYEVYIGSTWKF